MAHFPKIIKGTPNKEKRAHSPAKQPIERSGAAYCSCRLSLATFSGRDKRWLEYDQCEMGRVLHQGPVVTPPAPELHQDERPRYYEFGVYKADVLLRTLFRNGAPVPLVPKAFDTLIVLIERRDHVVSRD